MQSKPLLFLLHGWAMNPRVFDTLSAQLDGYFEIRAPSLPGHGVPVLPINTLASWAAHLGEQLPEASTLLGWSLGGQIAMRIALDHPRKVRRLILVSSTPAFVLDADWTAAISRSDLEAFGADLQRDTRSTLLRFLTLQTRGAGAQKMLLDTLRRTFFAAPLAEPQALAAGLEMLLHTDLRTHLPALVQPTLVVHGNADKLTLPAAGAWLATVLPNARLVPIKGAAHAPFLSHAQNVAEAIREWARD